MLNINIGTSLGVVFGYCEWDCFHVLFFNELVLEYRKTDDLCLLVFFFFFSCVLRDSSLDERRKIWCMMRLERLDGANCGRAL
jgi:hypothetical protein